MGNPMWRVDVLRWQGTAPDEVFERPNAKYALISWQEYEKLCQIRQGVQDLQRIIHVLLPKED